MGKNKDDIVVIELDEEFSIKKSSIIMKSKYDLSIYAIQLLNIVVTKTEEDVYIYSIKKDELFSLFDKDISVIYKQIKKAIKELMSKVIIIKNGNEEMFLHFVDKVIYKKRQDIVFYIDKDMLSILIEYKNNYLKYHIKNMKNLRKPYSLRLFEELKNKYEIQKKYKREISYSIDELRDFFMCSDKYDFYDIKRRLLEPAIKEINQHTDIYVTYKTETDGNRVYNVVFYVTDNKKNRYDKPEVKNIKNFVRFLRETYSGTGKYFIVGKLNNKVVWYGIDVNGKIFAKTTNGEEVYIDSDESMEIYNNVYMFAKKIEDYYNFLKEGRCYFDLYKIDVNKFTELNSKIIKVMDENC